MLSDGSPLNAEIESELEGVCPEEAEEVDCNARDLTFRPIDELCNNLLDPTIGNPDIAQLRLAPAFYENCKWNKNKAYLFRKLSCV